MSRRTARTGRGAGSGKQVAKQLAASRREDYRAKRRAVQPFVSFRIPTKYHPSAAKKLNRYAGYLFGDGKSDGQYGIARGVKVPVRRKDPDKLDKLKERYGQGESQGGLPGIKVAFVPTYLSTLTGQPVRPIIRHRKTGPDLIVFREETVTPRGTRRVVSEVETQYEPFDKEALMQDPDAEVRRVAGDLMGFLGVEDAKLVRFSIQNGSSQMRPAMSVDRMIADVRFHMSKYNKDDGHHWFKWMDGLTIEYAGNQQTLKQYADAKSGETRRREAVGKINLKWANLLRAIESTRGGGHTETLSRLTTGSTEDAKVVHQLLTTMRTKGLVKGDDSSWKLTRAGIDYLSKTRDILPLFNL